MTKKVNFEKIVIENFLSVGKKPVEIDFKSGIHVITGSNKDQSDRRNGIGKSTILDALSFVLFGSTLRELKKEFVINNITKKTAKVTLTFTVIEKNSVNKYELFRSIDPNKCYLYENGIDITRDSMVNTTEYVQNILRLTPEVFQNCIAMTLNNMIPFMAKKKIEKRKFIESIFKLEIFSEMNSLLKVEILEAKKELDIKLAKHEEIKKYYDVLLEQSKNKEKDKLNRKNTLTKRLEDNNKEIINLDEKIKKIQKLDLTSVNEKITMADNKVAELTLKINLVGKDISSLETKRDFTKASLLKIGTDKDTCPVCLKQVTEEDKNHIKEKKKGFNSEIQEYQKQIKVLEDKLSVYEQSKAKLKDAIYKLKDIVHKQNIQDEQKKHLLQKRTDIVSYNEHIVKDLDELERDNNDFASLLNDQKIKLDSSLNEVEIDRKDLNTLDYVKFVLSEDGVRSYIVKKILNLFNKKLSVYLRKLNSNAFIKFDEFFEETIVNSKNVETSYFNYSGAEKKIIDLAIMFTFIEMLRLQSNITYNIQFYDELLDTSLDEAGVELVVTLLNELTNHLKCGIYIISHRKECSKLSTGEVIYLEKRNGITQRIKFEGS